MATRDDRVSRLEDLLEPMPAPDVGTGEELVRHEAVRFAETFGSARPTFRTSVQLRFSGSAIEGHNLPGQLAGEVITRFSEAVKAAGARLQSAGPGSFDLFLSPNVAPGSAIIELFGVPRESAESDVIGGEILDTPVDAALGRLFAVLDGLDDSRPEIDLADAYERNIDGDLGKKLFLLARDLLSGDADLDLTWQRPRGSIRKVDFSRARARHLRDLLDRETLVETTRRGIGELVSISTEGHVAIRLTGARRSTTIQAGDLTPEQLREFWAKQVDATWIEAVLSHPDRNGQKITNTLTAVTLAAEFPTQPELGADN